MTASLLLVQGEATCTCPVIRASRTTKRDTIAQRGVTALLFLPASHFPPYQPHFHPTYPPPLPSTPTPIPSFPTYPLPISPSLPTHLTCPTSCPPHHSLAEPHVPMTGRREETLMAGKSREGMTQQVCTLGLVWGKEPILCFLFS